MGSAKDSRRPKSSRVDVAVLTVIPAELAAARAALGIQEGMREKDDIGTIYERGRIRSELTRRNYDLVLTCIGRPGNPLSAAAVQDIINRHRPSVVLLMGIAAGIKGKTKIGEVVLSERVVAYEPAAVVQALDNTSSLELRPEVRTTPHSIQQDVVHYQSDKARLENRFGQAGGVYPKPQRGNKPFHQQHVADRVSVKVATIASGEKLLRDEGKLLEFREIHGKVEVVEMEAAGLMEACERSGVPWLVVRGISDFGDGHKNDRFHDFASITAAAVLADFIEFGLEVPLHQRKLPMRVGPLASLLLIGFGILASLGAVFWHGRTTPPQPQAGSYAIRCNEKEKIDSSLLFKKENAVHILVTDFHESAASNLEAVSEQVSQVLRDLKEEYLRDPRNLDVEFPEDALEITRLPCFLDSHEQAEAMASASNSDVVIWGQAFRGASSNTLRFTPFTVGIRATLLRQGKGIRRSAPQMDVANLSHLDLLRLSSTEPFLLVYFSLGVHFYEMESYWLAARFFEKSAEQVLAREHDTGTFDMMLSMSYFHLPDLKRALQHSKSALARVSSSGSIEEGILLLDKGNVLHAMGEYVAALECFRQALAIVEKILGSNNSLVAACLSNIGNTLHKQGNYPAALEYQQRSLSLLNDSSDKYFADLSSCLSNVGVTLHSQGNYSLSLNYHRRALDVAEKTAGSEHPEITSYLINIGGVLHDQGNYPAALENYRRALGVAEKTMGRKHPAVAMALDGIGRSLCSQENCSEALEYDQRALAIVEQTLGPEHPLVANRLSNIGSVHLALHDYATALKYYTRALSVAEKTLGPEHPDVAIELSNIGVALHQQGKYPAALEYHRKALAIAERLLGSEHPDVAIDLNNIGKTLQSQGNYPAALVHYRRAVSIAERVFGPFHSKTIQFRLNLDLLSMKQEPSEWIIDVETGRIGKRP